MQFKNPEILYFLFLLLIPIIIHLFQLRRFKKTAFSNVAFLENVVQNTRKSNTLKKWLILATRLFALAGIILAFAQPFIPETKTALRRQETVVFIDNSFSMQAPGQKGTLLNEIKQDLLANLPKDKSFKLVTWDNQYTNFDPTTDRSVLLDLDYSAYTNSQENLMLQLQSLFSEDVTTAKQLIILSDFQDWSPVALDSSNIQVYPVQLNPVRYENVVIDSLSSEVQTSGYKFRVWLSALDQLESQVPVSVYGNDKLLTKATANFKSSDTASVTFSLETQNALAGKLSIEDSNLTYDNAFYFALGKAEPLQVLAISGSDSGFISRLYRAPEYDLTTVRFNNFDYSQIAGQNLIILNEVETLPPALVNQLKTHTEQGGVLILIPKMDTDGDTYSALLNSFGFAPFGEKNTDAQRITTINYDHPLYKNVFSNRTSNLQSHTLQSYFPLSAPDAILSLENGAPFLAEQNKLYVFTGAINTENSNFINGQLIVPTFDKMAREALRIPQLYYTLGTDISYDAEASLPEDAVLVLEAEGEQIIPLQQKRGAKISISETPGLSHAGVYAIKYKQDTLGLAAYNYDRKESVLSEDPGNEISGTQGRAESISQLFDDLQQASNLNFLSKWFVIFALLAFLAEMLILKYFK